MIAGIERARLRTSIQPDQLQSRLEALPYCSSLAHGGRSRLDD